MTLPQVTLPRIETLFKETDLDYSLEDGYIVATWPDVKLRVMVNDHALSFVMLLKGVDDFAQALDSVTYHNRNRLLPKMFLVRSGEEVTVSAECNFWVGNGMTDAQLREAFDLCIQSSLETIEELNRLLSSSDGKG